jgi:uncharacterized protein (DUF1800 family)
MSWLLLLGLAAGTPGGDPPAEPLAWDAQRAEHLLNRAGFGGNRAAIERALALGPESTVDELLAWDPWLEEPFYGRKRVDQEFRRSLQDLSEEEREKRMRAMRREDKEQLVDFLDWWLARLVRGEEPLRERMTLFWHGHFTSSIEVLKSSYEMIQQNQLLRRHALGSFRELLHGIARDPAMLCYLDNDVNRSEKPNENFARELMELFTLGEGNYSEEDVRAVARAFTGWTVKDGRFRFNPRWHDGGEKTVLGVTGALDGADVLEILLAQDACALYLARELLVYFEGLEPEPARLERYAALLRERGWRIEAFLRELFLDAEFYRPAALGTRIASPLDYLVGAVRRLELEPPGRLVFAGAALLGERLFAPPGVQGWEGGRSWITTSTLLMRGNLAGALVGEVSMKSVLAGVPAMEQPAEPAMRAGRGDEQRDEEEPRMEPVESGRLPSDMRELARTSWRPRLNLSQRLARARVHGDGELAALLLEDLLAIPVEADLGARVAALLSEKRAALGLEQEDWLTRPERSEPLLRTLAHEILSLPEAQLN